LGDTWTEQLGQQITEKVNNEVEQNNLNVPTELKNQLLDYVTSTLSSDAQPTKDLSNDTIGLDTDALQATRIQIQQWLGRS